MQKTRKKNKHTLFIIYGLSFSLLNFIVFWLYINVDTVVSTFDVPKEFKEVYGSFYYYKTIFKQVFLGENAAYQGAFGHTMIAMLINIIIFPIALITAYAFYKRVYGEKFFRVVFYLPSIIAITTLAMSFRTLFIDIRVMSDGEWYDLQGPISSLIKAFGYEGKTTLTVTDTPGTFGYDNIWSLIIIFSVFTGLGTNVVLMCGAMMRIPVDVTEALRIEGCGFFREMVSVTIPMIMPTITTWLIMIVTSVFGFSIAPMLLAGLTPANAGSVARTNTIPLIIYVNICSGRGDLGEITKQAQALGVIFSLMIMPIVLLTRYLCEKFTPDISY